jgi:hypothetical protein
VSPAAVATPAQQGRLEGSRRRMPLGDPWAAQLPLRAARSCVCHARPAAQAVGAWVDRSVDKLRARSPRTNGRRHRQPSRLTLPHPRFRVEGGGYEARRCRRLEALTLSSSATSKPLVCPRSSVPRRRATARERRVVPKADSDGLRGTLARPHCNADRQIARGSVGRFAVGLGRALTRACAGLGQPFEGAAEAGGPGGGCGDRSEARGPGCRASQGLRRHLSSAWCALSAGLRYC